MTIEVHNTDAIIKNSSYVIGVIKGEESRGSHAGVSQILVMVEDLRESGKKCNVMVMLPDCASTHELINKKATILAEGILTASYTFNNDIKYVFIEPTTVKELDKGFKLDEDPQFYLNYTLYNRVELVGEVSNVPTHKHIDSIGKGLLKFKIKFMGDGERHKTVNCTLWDTVNDLTSIEKGANIKIVASLNTTNRNTLGKELLEGEADYTTYNLLVQKIMDLDNSPQKIADNIYK